MPKRSDKFRPRLSREAAAVARLGDGAAVHGQRAAGTLDDVVICCHGSEE